MGVVSEQQEVEEVLGNPYASATVSPAALAIIISERSWKYYPHLQILNRLLLHLEARDIHRLFTTMPPQHGKSELISKYFPAWYLGRHPDHRVLHSSYEADFASYWSRKARDILEEFGPEIFGVQVNPSSSAAKHWELLGYEGGMQSSGVGGPLTGKKGNLINVDDPHKNWKEASSEVFQLAAEDWYTTAADTRLPKDGIINLVMTRWHPKDLGGRILEMEESVSAYEALQHLQEGGRYKDEWILLNLPAVCEDAKNDLLRRKEGDALCPDLFPIDVLRAKENRMTKYRFGALYQQHPTPRGGDLFEEDWFEIVRRAPTLENMVRWWDLASTEKTKKNKDPDWTAGLLLGLTDEGELWGLDLVHMQASPGKVKDKFTKTIVKDKGLGSVRQRIGLDPGQAGKDQAENYHRLVKKTDPDINFRAIPETGSKYTRADTVAGDLELNGPMKLYRAKGRAGNWVDDFLDEVLEYPNSPHNDIVDALSGGYSQLLKGRKRGNRLAISERKYEYSE